MDLPSYVMPGASFDETYGNENDHVWHIPRDRRWHAPMALCQPALALRGAKSDLVESFAGHLRPRASVQPATTS